MEMITTAKHIAPQIPLLPAEWHDCYNDGWQGIITKESFAHPAKFSKALIERIFDHCMERGWLKRGDVVGDCFGGIGNGGIVAAYRGLHWIGVELEPRFVKMAEANFALHRDHWRALCLPHPEIVQGDSRHFDQVVQCAGIVTSPPYAESAVGGGKLNISMDCENRDRRSSAYKAGVGYADESPGQIGRLKSGSVAAVVTSPPFSAPNMQPQTKQGCRRDLKAVGRVPESNTKDNRAIGNIETLQPGNLQAVVTSPPFEDSLCNAKMKVPHDSTGNFTTSYGDSSGQIGNDKGETYWSAMAQVYASCYAAIKPGGVIAVVVKDYVSKGKRVPLCDDTAKLLEHCGFRVVERVHAMLTKWTVESDLFAGTVTKKKERKSFFRRLAEKKGSPPIDFEEVIFAKRS